LNRNVDLSMTVSSSIRSQLLSLGLGVPEHLSCNESAASLYEQAIARGEVMVAEGGALVARTGAHTGRSPLDKFFVNDGVMEHAIWWDNNQAMTRACFQRLKEDFLAHARSARIFVQDLVAGADPRHEFPTRVICEQAWHALFIKHLLIERDEAEEFIPALTIIDLPSFRADPRIHGTRSEVVIAIDLANRLVLIGGTRYAGEIKKSVFTVLNHLLPQRGVFPMHCSANRGAEGDTALFFGLSGTGKTTLSADPKRELIGDDEHGWSEHGVFNIEGGCYAKVINLDAEAEPQIYKAAHGWGSILENVVMDEASRRIDLGDGSLTENTRAAYPIAAIPNARLEGRGGVPKNIIMLTCDAFGVLPPIAKLTPEQAVYHFLSGYTAKVAGTERGVAKPKATFSACFGQPFLPRHPSVYGSMLRGLIARHDVQCWLVNTGWTGGAYGQGSRMPIAATRALLNAALDGALDSTAYRTDPYFGFKVPLSIPGVDAKLMNPSETWVDTRAYDEQARKLVSMFIENFARFTDEAEMDVKAASPQLGLAAE
jgi:phosphoenolpyruvate carboxykinase (ATP)